MPTYRTGTVAALLSERPGLQRVAVDVDGEERRAYVLTRVVGAVAAGDQVVVNTTAVDLDLGTGGWDVVHWNLARTEWSEPGPGHVMKLRYTSLQADTGVAEEVPGYLPGHLRSVPVVALLLHSQLAPVAVAFAARAPGRRLVYVMTDGGALPLALSDLVADLCGAGLLASTVTAGQAFGGQHEAINVPSALEVARSVAGADAVVVGTGPGVVGTGGGRAFSGLEAADVLRWTGALGGTPILALRCSDADPRPRHRGISHHSVAVLDASRSLPKRPLVAVPAGPAGHAADGGDLPSGERHEVAVPDVAALLRARGISVTTMGRGPDEDPGFFTWAGAAGALAGALVGEGG